MDFEFLQLQKQQLDEIPQFLQQAYPGEVRKLDPGYLRWFYLQNPNADPDGLPLWVVRNNGRIVGQLATIPVQLKVGEVSTRAIWVLEFIVLEEFRGKGLGKKLVLAAREKYPTMITLGINDASTRVFTSLGWKPMGSIHRYHRMLFAGTAACTYGKHNWLRECLNSVSWPLRVSQGKRSSAAKYQIGRDTILGPEVDKFWESASSQWPVVVRRDHKFVQWQFLQQPGKAFEVVRLYERNRLVGYSILFFRKGRDNGPPPKAAISDLAYDSRNQTEIIDALLSASLDLAIERKAGSLVTDISDVRVEAQLRGHRFWRVKNSPRFMASSPDFQDILYEPKHWYLTRADSDLSIFEEPNVS